jgi:hypothetical protein
MVEDLQRTCLPSITEEGLVLNRNEISKHHFDRNLIFYYGIEFDFWVHIVSTLVLNAGTR